MTPTVKSWLDAARIYGQPRVISIFFLGIASGLPLLLTGGTLSVWLFESNVDKTTIGLFAMAGLPYTLKFVWSPLIDQVRLPFFTRAFGRRRGWMLFTQAMLAAALVGLGMTNPAVDPWTTALLALVVTFCSASQDIVIDAYRIEILSEKTYAAGAAMIVAGYRVGMIIAGAGALYAASVMSWQNVYILMAMLVGIGAITTILGREPTHAAVPKHASLADWLQSAVVAPFADFIQRRNWIAILAMILFYKLGDAFLSNMTNPFYLELGFSKIEIANVTKVFGLVATLLGGFAGGLLIARIGLWRGLLICGLMQMGSNLVFAWMASMGHDIGALTVTIAIENITGGMGTAALVAYLSSLCHTSYTATQYALLSSFTAVGRTLLSSGAGYMAEQMSWFSFFFVTTVLAVPGIVLILWLMRKESQHARVSL